MSFDLILVSFREGTSASLDRLAASSVLERSRYRHPVDADSSYYDISFDDGSDLELSAAGLDGSGKVFNGGMFMLRGGFTAPMAEFIYEFSKAAGCVIFPTMEPAMVLLPRDELAIHLPTDVKDDFKSVAINSGTELLALVSEGFEGWQRYRDYVMRKASAEPSPPT